MQNQPAPIPATQIACVNCKFARRMRLDPSQITKTLICKRLPPTAVLIPQAGGFMPAAISAPVPDHFFCFEFKPAEAGEIDSEGPPVLIVEQ